MSRATTNDAETANRDDCVALRMVGKHATVDDDIPESLASIPTTNRSHQSTLVGRASPKR